jgi:hypothetical protein
VKIEESGDSQPNVKLSDLKPGDPFWYVDELCIMTNETDDDGDPIPVRLSDGWGLRPEPQVVIRRAKARVVVDEPRPAPF